MTSLDRKGKGKYVEACGRLAVLFAIAAILASAAAASNDAVSKVDPTLLEIIANRGSSIGALSEGEQNLVVLIKADEANFRKVQNVVEQNGGRVRGSYDIGDVISAEADPSSIMEMAESEAVEYVWANREYNVLLDKSLPQIGVPDLWETGLRGKNVKVAVLDTGIQESHPMLAGRVIASMSFVDDIPLDVHGHGTHVAGIIAGSKASGGQFDGVAPEALLINAKVLSDSGTGTDEQAIAGINWALNPDGNPETDDGADAISMSLGIPANVFTPLNDAVVEAVSEGIPVVIAAGNCGTLSPSCNGYVGISSPGNTEEAITVGAVDASGNLVPFSAGHDFGTYLKPDVTAPGVGIKSSFPVDDFAALSGTSMATPHVSGIVALLLEKTPELTPSEIKYLLEVTSTPKGAPGKDIQYGSGIANASKLLLDNVGVILKNRVELPASVFLGESVDVEVRTTELASRVSLEVVTPSGNAITKELANPNPNRWTTVLTETSELGVYHAVVLITAPDSSMVRIPRAFDVISTSGNELVIDSIDVSDAVKNSETASIKVNFRNLNQDSLETIIELRILNSGGWIVDSQEAGYTAVVGSNTFSFEWDPSGYIGELVAEVIVSSEDSSDSKRKVFTVIDGVPPKIAAITNVGDRNLYDLMIVDVYANDDAAVNGKIMLQTPSVLEELQLRLASSIGRLQTLRQIKPLTEKGTYTFKVRLCDSHLQCSESEEQSFEVVDSCLGKRLLHVKEKNAESAFDTLQGYCISSAAIRGDVLVSDYLKLFDGIVWSSFASPLIENAGTLEEYVAGDKPRLIIEGDGALAYHSIGSFSTNVLHSTLNDRFFAEENEPISLGHSINHPITQSFTGSHLTSGMVSTAVPLRDSSSLASIPRGSVLIAFNDGSSKILHMPVEANRFSSAALAQNAADWLLSDTISDVSVHSVTHDLLVSGQNLIDVKFNAIGYFGDVRVNVDFYIGNQTLGSAILEGPVIDDTITKRFLLELSEGEGVFRIVVNDDNSYPESNYLNNIYEEKVTVLNEKADLNFEKSDYEYNESSGITTLSVFVANVGGSSADNVAVEADINGFVIQFEEISIKPMETTSVKKQIEIAPGSHPITLTIDPDNKIDEFNESNNVLESHLYVCSKRRILIVSDNDAASSSSKAAESSVSIAESLSRSGYCADVWSQKDNGNVSPDKAEEYGMVVWSTGNYWNGIINPEDEDFLRVYNKGILMEGADVGFEKFESQLLDELFGAGFDSDLFLEAETQLNLKEHPVFNDVHSITINPEMSLRPDSMTVSSAESIAEWPEGGTAIALLETQDRATALMAFSAAALGAETRDKVLPNLVEWILDNQNEPPKITFIQNVSIESLTVTMKEGQNRTFEVVATDPDGDELSYEWLLNGTLVSTGTNYTFYPGYEDSGTYNLTIVVSDGKAETRAEITITVLNTNRAPKLIELPPAPSHIEEGSSYLFEVYAEDPDGDEVAYSWRLDGEEVSPAKSYNYSPGYNDSGTHEIEINVSDGNLSDAYGFEVLVTNTNRPPILSLIGNKTVAENGTLAFAVSADDPDGDFIRLDMLPLDVDGVSFDSDTGVFEWTPNFDQAGIYEFVFNATDLLLSDEEGINITVENTNRPPQILMIIIDPPGTTMKTGEEKTFTVASGDDDGNGLQYEWKLDGNVVAVSTPEYTYSPGKGDGGRHVLEVSVSDGREAATQRIEVTVLEHGRCNSEWLCLGMEVDEVRGEWEGNDEEVWPLRFDISGQALLMDGNDSSGLEAEVMISSDAGSWPAGKEVGLCSETSGGTYCVTYRWDRYNVLTVSKLRGHGKPDGLSYGQPRMNSRRFNMKMAVLDSTVKGKIWPVGSVEPEWQVSYDTREEAAGRHGYYSYGTDAVFSGVSPDKKNESGKENICLNLLNSISASLGSSCGDVSYSAAVDVNRDGAVDIKDLTAVGRRFGSEEWCAEQLKSNASVCG